MRVVGLHHRVVADFGKNTVHHRFGRTVIGVGLPQAGPQASFGVFDCPPRFGVREGVALEVLAAAGTDERQLVGEVTVDGDPPHPCALGDLADGRGRRAERLVQLDCGLDDSLAGLFLAFGAPPELVRTGHHNHDTPRISKVDSPSTAGYGGNL